MASSRATRFIDACYCKPTDCTPVWLMRQAGRYQASYRKLREKVSFFQLCRSPALAAQVTVRAVEELGVDAGIIFSDILVPIGPMGPAVTLTEKGPQIDQPVRDRAAIDRLKVFEPQQELPYVMDSIRLVVEQLNGEVPLIGFAGAPLTLASYLVEGGHSKSFVNLKGMLFSDADAAHRLMEKLASVVVRHLRAQVEAGCKAVQLFDSWAGMLGPRDYREFCLPYLKRIFDELAPLGVPRILFGTSTATLLEVMRESGPEVIGLDWRVELDDVRRRLGRGIALQGNLDPCCLLMDESRLLQRVQENLKQAGNLRGHIFNLGHGVLPPTAPERARFVVDTVHRLTRGAVATDG